MTPHSTVAHLAMTLWPSRSWGSLLIGMFTAHFDASGQEHEHSYVVVAGFVSSAQEWILFSEKWQTVLHEYGLESFHAAECQNYEQDFKGWKGQDSRRIRLWCDLLALIKESSFQKFACGIVTDDWTSKVSKQTKDRWRLNAYVMCAMMVAERVQLWARRQNIHTPIRYVYESGDPGSGMLFETFRREGYPDPLFEHKTDRTINGILVPACIPLQAADFLAYEIFLTKKILAKGGKPALTRPIHTFDEMAEKIRIFKGSKLDDLERNFKKHVKVKNLWTIS